MPDYKAPLRDMRFLIDNVFDFHGHYAALGATDASPDMVSAILEEGAKFCENVLAPLKYKLDFLLTSYNKWSNGIRSILS